VHKSTISRLLKRQGWRKPVPRPRHPQAHELRNEMEPVANERKNMPP